MFPSFTDILAERTEDIGTDFIVKDHGANQFLGDQAAKHDGQSTKGPRANRVQDGRVPRTSGPTIGSPSPAQPLGARSGESLTG